MNCVERIAEYINKKEKEEDWDQPIPDNNWPKQGSYEVQNIKYKYRS